MTKTFIWCLNSWVSIVIMACCRGLSFVFVLSSARNWFARRDSCQFIGRHS